MTLVTGGSKAEAALNGVGFAIAHKVLGPLAYVAGASLSALKAVVSLTKGFAGMGMASAASMEKVQNQLRVMLKGLDAAKQRVREMQAFSVKTPFSMKDVVAGNRVMESMGRGALSTKEMMTLVGDAAAQAGTDFEGMAVYVGRLYDGLAAGRPVGEVLFRLAELGVISGTARTRLEQLQASGAGFAEVWGVVEGELKRSAGTMEFTSRTMEGMQQAASDASDQMQAAFSMNFLEGQKASLEAQAQTMKNLTPVAADLGQSFSRVINVSSSMVDKALAWVTSFKAVQVALGAAARGVVVLTTAIVGLSAVMALVKVWGLVGGMVALGRAALVARLGVTMLGRSLLLLLSGPVALLAVALLVLVTALDMMHGRTLRAKEAVREYDGATRSLVTSLQAQAMAIKKLDDLSLGYQQTLGKLREAYEQQATASVEGNGPQQRAAAERIAYLRAHLEYLDQINRATLEMPQSVVETMSRVKDNQRATGSAEREARRQTMTPGELEGDLNKEADEMLARRESAAREIAGQIAYTEGGAEAQTNLARNRTQQTEVTEGMRAWEAEKNKSGATGAGTSGATGARLGGYTGEGVTETDTAKTELAKKELDLLAGKLAVLKQEEEALTAATMDQAKASGSEIAVMMEKLKVWDSFSAAQAAVAAAEAARDEAAAAAGADEQKLKRVEELNVALEDQRKTLDLLAAAAAGQEMTPVAAQAMRAEVERRRAEAGGDLMNRPEEIRLRQQAEAVRRAAEIGGRNVELDAATAEAGMAGRLAGEQAALDAERERLMLAVELENMDERTYKARQRMLDVDQQRLDIQKEIAEESRKGEFKAEGLDLRAKAARMGGKGDKMRELEEEAALAREEAGRKAREQALMDSGLTQEEAIKQTQAEFNRNRLGREMDKESGALGLALGERSVSDSMAKIGGGGSTYGGGDPKAVLDRLDRLIKAVEAQGQEEPMLR